MDSLDIEKSSDTSVSAPILRKPTLQDAAAIRQVAVESQVLEPNSLYCYLLLCQHFADTCVVAEHAEKVVGFVTAYRPPISPNVVFVWQIGVAEAMRGRRLGLAILQALLHHEACRDVSFLEATVTPSNTASQALFRSLARRLGTKCEEKLYFAEALFSGGSSEGNHEAEYLFRIGPFKLEG